MLGKLFKPHWQHAKADVRLKAVAQLDLADPAQQEILIKLAKGDCDAGVRCGAINRITDLALLQKLGADADASVQQAAGKRQLALLAGTAADAPSLDNRLRAIRLLNNKLLLERLLDAARDSSCLLAALERLDDQAAYARFAIAGGEISLREQAATRVTEASLLRQLARDGRDKKIVQFARDALKQQQAQQQQQEAQQQQLGELLTQLAQHAKRSLDPLYQARLAHLNEQWQSLAPHASSEQAQAAAVSLSEATQKIAAQQQQAQQQQAEADAKLQQAHSLAGFEHFFASLDAEQWQLGLNPLNSAFALLERGWQEATRQFPANAQHSTQQQAFRQEWQRLTQLYQQLEDSSCAPQDRATLLASWPAEIAAPTWITELQQYTTLAPVAQLVTHPVAKAGPQRPRHGGLLHQLRQSLKARHLKDANRAWQRFEHALAKHPDEASASQSQTLKTQLDELRDWHAFAADPKKDELCQQMQALVATPLSHPEEQANAIQALHDQWHELMSANQEADQSLWDNFKQASDAAYDHCRDYFRELDAKRAEMLKQRENIYQQLHDFLAQQDWDKADGNALWQIRCQAPKDWQAASPVRFTDARDVNQRFHQLLKLFDQQLEQLSQAHLPQLEKLLQQLEALSAQTDNDQATRGAKQIQHQWREVGWVHPQQFRKLDKRKRTFCDAIFAKQQLALKLAQDKQQQLAHELQQELDQLKGLLDAPTQDIAQLDAAMSQLRQQPEPERNRALSQQKQALLQRASSSRQQQLRQQQWQEWQQRLTQAPTASTNEAVRELCIAMEVSAGCTSPESEGEQRLAWQVKHLAAAMKKERQTPEQACSKLLEDARALVEAGLDADSRTRLLLVLDRLISG